MKKLALITALVLATSAVAAQVVTDTTTGTRNNDRCFLQRESDRDVLQRATGPNTRGYGSSGVFGSSSASGVASSFYAPQESEGAPQSWMSSSTVGFERV
jgi:hypothetical protein